MPRWPSSVDAGTILRIEVAGDTCALHGEVDVSTVHLLRHALDELHRTRPGDVLVDLGGLSFLSAAGLRALLDVREELRRDGQDLRLLRPSCHVRRVLALGGLVAPQ